MSISRIAVLGTGANGAAFAADLTRAGHDVTLIDQWPENVEAMRSNGVKVDDGDSQRTTRVSARHLSDIATMREPFDLVVLGVEGYDTRWSCELIRPLLAADGLVVGMQNGMTMETIADVVGNHRTVGCVIEVAANMFVPGHVQQQAPMWFALGVNEEGPAQRIPEVVSVFGIRRHGDVNRRHLLVQVDETDCELLRTGDVRDPQSAPCRSDQGSGHV